MIAITGAATSVDEVRQDGGADERADGAGDADLGDDLPVDVAELPVRGAGDQRGADLGEVDGGRGGSGVGADGQQQGRGGDAVGHAEAAVDELGEEADQGDQKEGPHGTGLRVSGPPARARRSAAGRTRGRAVRRGRSAARTATGADAQQVDVDPPHEEHRRRRHGPMSTSPIDYVQRAVPHVRDASSRLRTSFRMVAHEITPPAANSAAQIDHRHPEAAGERGGVGVVVTGQARPPPAARRPRAAARPGRRRCSRRWRCRPARRAPRPARWPSAGRPSAAMPRPCSTRAGQDLDDVGRAARRRRPASSVPAATISGPTVIGSRGPIRVASAPARGESSVISAIVGSRAAPAGRGVVAEHRLQLQARGTARCRRAPRRRRAWRCWRR